MPIPNKLMNAVDEVFREEGRAHNVTFEGQLATRRKGRLSRMYPQIHWRTARARLRIRRYI